MSNMTLEQEFLEVVRRMTPEQQRKLLEHARTIARPQGTPGKLAVQYAREIGFSKEDLIEMAQAIEEWCDRPAIKFQ